MTVLLNDIPIFISKSYNRISMIKIISNTIFSKGITKQMYLGLAVSNLRDAYDRETDRGKGIEISKILDKVEELLNDTNSDLFQE